MAEYHRPIRRIFSIVLIVQIIAIIAILGLITYGVETVEMVADQDVPSSGATIFYACFSPLW